jgi:hypothetical protein
LGSSAFLAIARDELGVKVVTELEPPLSESSNDDSDHRLTDSSKRSREGSPLNDRFGKHRRLLDESPSSGPTVQSPFPNETVINSQGISSAGDNTDSQGPSSFADNTDSQGPSSFANSTDSQGSSSFADSTDSQGLSSFSEISDNQAFPFSSEVPDSQGFSSSGLTLETQSFVVESAENHSCEWTDRMREMEVDLKDLRMRMSRIETASKFI